MAAEDGVVRIAGSRVSLESLLYHYKAGATPEQIACKFPSLRLADTYSEWQNVIRYLPL